jgi:peroxiredoxin
VTSSSSRQLTTLALSFVFGVLVTLGTVLVAHGRDNRGSELADGRLNAIGRVLPSLTLQSIEGDPIDLRERVGKRPSVLYVFGANECAGCSNLGLEFQILRGLIPSVQPLLIGSGAKPEVFRPFVQPLGVGSSVFIDQKRQLLHALGAPKEPVVALIDSTGRILYIDTRSASQAAQYPMGRLLHAIRATLSTTR